MSISALKPCLTLPTVPTLLCLEKYFPYAKATAEPTEIEVVSNIAKHGLCQVVAAAGERVRKNK